MCARKNTPRKVIKAEIERGNRITARERAENDEQQFSVGRCRVRVNRNKDKHNLCAIRPLSIYHLVACSDLCLMVLVHHWKCVFSFWIFAFYFHHFSNFFRLSFIFFGIVFPQYFLLLLLLLLVVVRLRFFLFLHCSFPLQLVIIMWHNRNDFW